MYTSPSRQPLLQKIIETETDIAIDQLWREEGICVGFAARKRWQSFVMHRVCTALQHSVHGGHETADRVIDHAVQHALRALVSRKRVQESPIAHSVRSRIRLFLKTLGEIALSLMI